jgi:hypothetical protein
LLTGIRVCMTAYLLTGTDGTDVPVNLHVMAYPFHELWDELANLRGKTFLVPHVHPP